MGDYLSLHNMRELSGNMEFDYRTDKKKTFSISHPIFQTEVNTICIMGC